MLSSFNKNLEKGLKGTLGKIETEEEKSKIALAIFVLNLLYFSPQTIHIYVDQASLCRISLTYSTLFVIT